MGKSEFVCNKALTFIYYLKRVIYFLETPYRRIVLFSILLLFAEENHIAMKKLVMHTEKKDCFSEPAC